MPATLVLSNSLTEALRLGRRPLRAGSPSWSFSAYDARTLTLSPGTTVALGTADFLYLTSDQPVVVGWTPAGASTPVEQAVDGMTLMTGNLPALYVKNPTGAGVLSASVRAVTANK